MTARGIAALLLSFAMACASAPPPPEIQVPVAGPGVLYAIGSGLGESIKIYELDEDEAREVARGMVDTARAEPHEPLTPETGGLIATFHEQRLRAVALRDDDEQAGAGAPLLEAAAESRLPAAGPGVLYAIGSGLGEPIKIYELDEDEAREVARGLVDTARGRPHDAPLTPETSGLMATFHEQRLRALALREERAGAPLLDAAAREPGAVRTESGMVLRVIDRGSGEPPSIWDFVTINYYGTRRDGSVFYSNRGRPPERIRLGTDTRCWQEAFTAVGVGARLHVVCPPALGYMWGGWLDTVPGGAVLTYDLELLSVERMPEPPEP